MIRNILIALTFSAICFANIVRRDANICTAICGENQVYARCLQTCRPTCDDQHPYCEQDCARSGCQCRAGYVYQGDKCVHNSQCPPRQKDSISKRCSYSSQCASNEHCDSNGYCIVPRRCSNEAPKETHRCKPKAQIQTHTKCRYHDDCSNGYLCVDRYCKLSTYMGVNEHVQSGTTLCRTDRDCEPIGKHCMDRICK
ncbi:unnamed protein product [Caenorhabditis angaria]|uniref:TIL domain-containing protein n=1 Tax=Caenorhabditis angaria TaxID=860376 RepID=A0A9P1J0Z4_9PELO|nr:unnamed protein product [Caenorhabditis angaria]